MDPRKVFGREGEKAAVSHLLLNGADILMRNFRCRYGEIDIIAMEGPCYLVVEVKTRNRENQGYAGEAVDYRKQKKICRAFDYFRTRFRLADDIPVRFDVIEVDPGLNCRWIKNAFEYLERNSFL